MRLLTALVALSLVAGDSPALGRRSRRVASCEAPRAVEYVGATTPAPSGDALSEVNAARAARGLRPYLRDEGLTLAAERAASFRASLRIAGHTKNDFSFLPPGSSASAAGCGALDPSWGWASCCTYDGYARAGAAVAYGADGRRYMHIFVK